MHKTYSTHLENLKGRRYDEVLQESVLSDSFHSQELPEVVTYALESMKEIDPSYSYKLFASFRSTQILVAERLEKNGVDVDCRYIGPHNCETHISLYGGLELLAILKKYDGKPSEQVNMMAGQIIEILNDAKAYDMVDYSDQFKIRVRTRKPTSDVNIIPAIWVDTPLFQKTGLEINRSVCHYNFGKKTRRVYLPFLNMARLNSRDRKLGGSPKSLIRLLLSLIMDSEESINLTYDEIVGVIYNMSTKELAVPQNQHLSLLPNVSLQLKQLINDNDFREKLVSPSKREYVFGKRSKSDELTKLKTEVDILIEDLNSALKELNKSLTSPFDY